MAAERLAALNKEKKLLEAQEKQKNQERDYEFLMQIARDARKKRKQAQLTKKGLEMQMNEEKANKVTKSTAAYMKEILVDNMEKKAEQFLKSGGAAADEDEWSKLKN